MGKDTFHKIRLLKAPPNMTLNTTNNGASTTSLGNLFHCLATLIIKNIFLISKSTLFQFKTITLCPVFTGPGKSLSPSFLEALLKYWNTATRSPLSLLSSRLNNANPLSRSSQEKCSSPLIISMALLWTPSNRSMPFLCWGLQSWMQDARGILTRAE